MWIGRPPYFPFRCSKASKTTPEPWVEQVTQRVAEHVRAPDHDAQGQTGPERQVRGQFHELPAFSAEHAAPARHIGGQTESEKAQNGLGKNVAAYTGTEYDDHGRHDIGQNMVGEDAMNGNADCLGGRQEQTLLDGYDGASRQPGTGFSRCCRSRFVFSVCRLVTLHHRHHRLIRNRQHQPRTLHPSLSTLLFLETYCERSI